MAQPGLKVCLWYSVSVLLMVLSVVEAIYSAGNGLRVRSGADSNCFGDQLVLVAVTCWWYPMLLHVSELESFNIYIWAL